MIPDLKNASLHLAVQLFMQVYPISSPQFFKSIISLVRQYPASEPLLSPSLSSSPTPLNPQSTDLLLRLLHEVSLEISDVMLRLNKSPLRLTKDAELRDSVRETDAVGIAQTVWDILAESLDGVAREADGGRGLKGKEAREIAEMAVMVVGDYVCK